MDYPLSKKLFESILNNLSEIRTTIRKVGFSGLCKEAWLTIVIRGPLYPLLSSVFDRVTHEKIAQAPCVGYWPRLEHPRTFNEKISHRKLFSDERLYTMVSDKHTARGYVKSKTNGDLLNKLYFVSNDPSEIPFESLPQDFVVKSTHGSGHVRIVDDKEKEDYADIRVECQKWLTQDFGKRNGEYWYTNIEPKIIVEERMQVADREVPLDYKVFVFNGTAKYIQVNIGRFSDLTERFYDTDWSPMEFTHAYEKGPTVEEPENLDELLEAAEKIGSDFDFARIDLYDTDKGIRFGEITLAPGSGYLWFRPNEWDFRLGSLWRFS